MLGTTLQTVLRSVRKGLQIVQIEFERFLVENDALSFVVVRYLSPRFEIDLQMGLPGKRRCLLRTTIVRIHLKDFRQNIELEKTDAFRNNSSRDQRC